MIDEKLAPDKILTLQSQNPLQQPVELYHLSHDLRGPLNSMLGFAELLIEGIEGPLNDIQIEDISAIRQSARNLLHLINTIVDLSKLDAGQVTLNLVPVDLVQLVQNIVIHELEIVQIEFVANFPDALPLVLGDQTRIKQMLLNLLNFAAKVQKEGVVNISSAYNPGSVTVQISIGGATFLPEQIDNLFELKVHTDSAGRSELGKGGVELPLVQRLAQQHGGRAWAERNPGSGTTFYLKLPTEQPE